MTWLSELGIYQSVFREGQTYGESEFYPSEKKILQVECRFFYKGGP